MMKEGGDCIEQDGGDCMIEEDGGGVNCDGDVECGAEMSLPVPGPKCMSAGAGRTVAVVFCPMVFDKAPWV